MSESLINNYRSISRILPVLCILGTLFTNIIIQLVARPHLAPRWLLGSTLLGISWSYYTTLQISKSLTAHADISLWNDLLHITNWTTHTNLLSIGITFLMVLIIYTDNNISRTGTFPICIMGLLLGVYLLPLSNHWLMIYMSSTCIGLSSTVLIYNQGKLQHAILASQKYLLLSTIASALMIFGMSYVYGATGTLKISMFPVDPTHACCLSNIGSIGFLLALSSLLMIIGSFPYQFWIADIYAAIPFSLVAYLSTITKVTVVSLLVNIGQLISHETSPACTAIINLWAIIAVFTMVCGHFAALTTWNFARLLAYGNIAQTGFLLALLVTDLHTYNHISYYLIVYSIINVAAWLGLSILHQATHSLAIQDFAGLGRRFPIVSTCLTIVILALVGLPPTAGFTAKLFLWNNLWQSIQVTKNPFVIILLIIGLLGTLMAFYYYLKIPYILFCKTSKNKATTPTIGPSLIQLLVIILTGLLIGLFIVGGIPKLSSGSY